MAQRIASPPWFACRVRWRSSLYRIGWRAKPHGRLAYCLASSSYEKVGSLLSRPASDNADNRPHVGRGSASVLGACASFAIPPKPRLMMTERDCAPSSRATSALSVGRPIRRRQHEAWLLDHVDSEVESPGREQTGKCPRQFGYVLALTRVLMGWLAGWFLWQTMALARTVPKGQASEATVVLSRKTSRWPRSNWAEPLLVHRDESACSSPQRKSRPGGRGIMGTVKPGVGQRQARWTAYPATGSRQKQEFFGNWRYWRRGSVFVLGR